MAVHPRRPCPQRDTRRESRARTPRGEGRRACGLPSGRRRRLLPGSAPLLGQGRGTTWLGPCLGRTARRGAGPGLATGPAEERATGLRGSLGPRQEEDELGWRVGGRGGGKGSWPKRIEKGFPKYDKGFEIYPVRY